MILVFILFGLAAAAPTSPNNGDDGNKTAEMTLQDYRKNCRGLSYSTECVKGDMLRLVRVLSISPAYQILPGVTVSSSGLSKRSGDFNNTSLDLLLAETLADYLRSLTLHVAIYNQEALDFIYSHEQDLDTGRSKKFKFLSIYTVFAVAFALLSALVGKAMTLSIVSLVIAMIARNAPGNSPPNTPPVTYDIVRRPQVQIAATHSQEDVYEGAHSKLQPVSYVYPTYPRISRNINELPYKAFSPNKTKIN